MSVRRSRRYTPPKAQPIKKWKNGVYARYVGDDDCIPSCPDCAPEIRISTDICPSAEVGCECGLAFLAHSRTGDPLELAKEAFHQHALEEERRTGRRHA
jgi:hypothetical protein